MYKATALLVPALRFLIFGSQTTIITAVSAFQEALSNAQSCATTNQVLQRNDAVGMTFNTSRPWSIHQATYQPSGPWCETSRNLSFSLAGGHRVWNNPSEANEPNPEAFQSFFAPLKCSFKWFSPREACTVLSRYSTLYFVGDSLTRHLVQAVDIILNGNFEYGALPHGKPSRIYDDCRCDGQFSEASECRNSIDNFMDNRAAGLCPGATTHFALIHNGGMLGNETLVSQTDTRPVFFFLSAGTHHKMDADETIRKFLKPNLAKIAAVSGPRVLTSWGAMGAQGRLLDTKYPHQSRENSAIFNHRIAEYALNNGVNTVFDWWNLTKGAQASDGLHLLTDVNVIKAQYIINWLSLSQRGL
jgi:hypothetical protein